MAKPKINVAERKAQRQIEKQQANAPRMLQKMITSVVGVAGFISAIFTIYLYFYSPISVTPGELLNGDPMSSPFTLTNTLAVSVNRVDPSCHITDVKFKNGIQFQDDTLVDDTPKTPSLAAGEQEAIYCEGNGKLTYGPLEYADITLAIGYSPVWIPFIHKTKFARFITLRDSEGTLRWTPYAQTNAPPIFH